jgi:hypothetical protein
MKNHFKIIPPTIFLFTTDCCIAQRNDTVTISLCNLNLKTVKYGKINYVVYDKKTKESPSEGIFLAKINVEPKIYNGRPAIAITQQWSSEDTVRCTVIADSVKSKVIQDFNELFASYNLSWHSGLIIFTMSPYKENRILKLICFDPGFGKSTQEIYSVTGSDILTTSSGKRTDCWVLEIKDPSKDANEIVLADKNATEVPKEEIFFNNGYRYSQN